MFVNHIVAVCGHANADFKSSNQLTVRSHLLCRHAEVSLTGARPHIDIS